jgi:hypothetical protein
MLWMEYPQAFVGEEIIELLGALHQQSFRCPASQTPSQRVTRNPVGWRQASDLHPHMPSPRGPAPQPQFDAGNSKGLMQLPCNSERDVSVALSGNSEKSSNLSAQK